MAKVIQVIETHERRGKGTEEDPVRLIYQLWSLEGQKIYEEKDEFKEVNK